MLELFLITGLATTHINGTKDTFNNDNNLIAVQTNEFVVGTLVNSYYKRSYLLAYDYRWNDWSGVLLGGISGYDYDCFASCGQDEVSGDDVFPVVAPYVSYKGWTVALQGTALSLSFKFQL